MILDLFVRKKHVCEKMWHKKRTKLEIQTILLKTNICYNTEEI